MKKEIADDYKNSKDVNDIKEKFDKFNEMIRQDDLEYLKQNLQFAAPEVEMNYLDNKEYILMTDKDHKVLKQYYETIVNTRPEMIKEQKYELPYEWDFEIDLKNYDPWKEYQLLYKDIFQKGRKYFILKTIPEWRLLQIGKTNSFKVNNISQFEPKRRNYRDSIFKFIRTEEWFTERERKQGINRGKSQAIRI